MRGEIEDRFIHECCCFQRARCGRRWGHEFPSGRWPSRRRSFSPAQKLRHLVEYEAACQTGQGGACLRREGLYSSLISEWRRLRDAGLLEGKEPGARIGRTTAEQPEIARLRRRAEQAEAEFATTRTALDIVEEHPNQPGRPRRRR